MFLRMIRSRPRSAPAWRCGVRPAIEPLESRASPSTFQPDSLLTCAFAAPLAQATDPLGQSVAAAVTTLPPLVPAGVGGLDQSAHAVPAPTLGPAALDVGANPSGPDYGTDLLLTTRGSNQQQSGPVITEFHASEGERGWWTFQGVVVADNPWGLTVRFGGLPSLQGQTTEVQDDGTFQLTIRLQNGEEGIATAQTTDWQGQDSNVAHDYVHQSNGVVVIQR